MNEQFNPVILIKGRIVNNCSCCINAAIIPSTSSINMEPICKTRSELHPLIHPRKWFE
jgi:hypothetical protein